MSFSAYTFGSFSFCNVGSEPVLLYRMIGPVNPRWRSAGISVVAPASDASVRNISGSPVRMDCACGARSAAVSGRVVLLVTVMLYFGPHRSWTFWTHFAPAAVSAWAVATLIGLP